MNSSVARHRLQMLLLGRRWRISLVGIAVVAGYDLAMLGAGMVLQVNLGLLGYAGGAVGGLVAGAMVGTNWEDGVTLGLRASLLGAAAVAVIFVLGSFAYWFATSGTSFFYWSSLLGALALVFLAPIHLFTGAIGGILGVLLRRAVIPARYNPPAY